MATGFRALGNKHVWVEETGEGSSTLVGIHGLGGTCNIYGPQIAALGGAHRFVTFDLNGHGMSPMVGPISIENWADDVVALMDDLELAEVALVSHSMGTLVAQQVMAIAGERIRASALLGPVRNLPDAARSA
ncbi:MAG: alpha/beta fold hydrolase, partial [Acidimicrobiia bacterium]|nr:alpha/beta fold hydrolase [Acidimicrobiia bacterium]